MHARAPLVLLAAVALVGCLGAPAVDSAPAAPEDAGFLRALAAAPVPDLDGARVDAWLAAFVAEHAPRLTGTPQEEAAGDALAADLASLGYEVSLLRYLPTNAPDANGPLRVVLGLRPGLVEPERWIVIGAHYDTSYRGPGPVAGVPFPGVAIEGAYDNGSGTAIALELARLLAAAPTNRTVAIAFFNGEEEGTLASNAFVNHVPEGVTIDSYVGLDMVGINWPSPTACLCLSPWDTYNATLVPLLRGVVFDHLGFPDDGRSVLVFDNNTRRSDERTFAAAGVPTVRLAGGLTARAYPAYHQVNDTMETVYATAGSRDLWIAGVEAATAAAYYTVFALDHARIERLAP